MKFLKVQSYSFQPTWKNIKNIYFPKYSSHLSDAFSCRCCCKIPTFSRTSTWILRFCGLEVYLCSSSPILACVPCKWGLIRSEPRCQKPSDLSLSFIHFFIHNFCCNMIISQPGINKIQKAFEVFIARVDWLSCFSVLAPKSLLGSRKSNNFHPQWYSQTKVRNLTIFCSSFELCFTKRDNLTLSKRIQLNPFR